MKFTTHSHDRMVSNGVSINGGEWSSQATLTTPFVARLGHLFLCSYKGYTKVRRVRYLPKRRRGRGKEGRVRVRALRAGWRSGWRGLR